jgi:hypothetical protein
MKKLSKIAWVIGCLIIIAIGGAIGKNIGKSTYKSIEQGRVDRAIEEKLLETSRSINRQLPLMVDPETRLDMTMCNGKEMYYKYTMVLVSENELDKNRFKNDMAVILRRNNCSNEKMIKTLTMGVEYNYIYLDRNGIEIAAIKITKKICGL